MQIDSLTFQSGPINLDALFDGVKQERVCYVISDAETGKVIAVGPTGTPAETRKGLETFERLSPTPESESISIVTRDEARRIQRLLLQGRH